MHKIGFFRSIQLKFILIYILLLLVAVQVIGSYFATKLEKELNTNYKSSVEERIKLMSYNLEQIFKKERPENPENTQEPDAPTLEQEVQNAIDDIDTKDFTTLQVVNSQGRVLGTNDTLNYDIVGKKSTEDVVQKALAGTDQDKMLYDPKMDSRVLVKAVHINDQNGNVAGVIYIVVSLKSVYDQLQNISEIFLKASILAIIISAFLGVLVARTITKPIKEMRRQAQTIARGDFSQNVNVYGKDEIGQLAVSFNDMNDRLRHSYATVEEEQRKLTSVLENMSDGVIATDVNGMITLMNEPAGILLGRNPEDCKERYLQDVLQMDREKLHVESLAEHGSAIFDFGDEENDLLIRANFSTVLDEDEDTAAYILVLSDVTEQEKVEAERREFVSNVSHELRTPLTTMRSYIEALTDGAWQDKNIAPRFLQVTQNETERMIRMVNDLLQLSKMDSSDYKLEQERVDFVAFFHEVIDRFEMNVPEHITFKRELPPQHMFVWIDRDKMIQVLDNVISNAIKYSPDGGKIYFRITKQRHRILASIEDEGLGIPYDKVDKVFERFYRSDKARSRKLGGTGLGLAISKELVEAHDGDIWAKSREGKGTTVFIALPLMGQDRGASK